MRTCVFVYTCTSAQMICGHLRRWCVNGPHNVRFLFIATVTGVHAHIHSRRTFSKTSHDTLQMFRRETICAHQCGVCVHNKTAQRPLPLYVCVRAINVCAGVIQSTNANSSRAVPRTLSLCALWTAYSPAAHMQSRVGTPVALQSQLWVFTAWHENTRASHAIHKYMRPFVFDCLVRLICTGISYVTLHRLTIVYVNVSCTMPLSIICYSE